jgi:hypothetical protein
MIKEELTIYRITYLVHAYNIPTLLVINNDKMRIYFIFMEGERGHERTKDKNISRF